MAARVPSAVSTLQTSQAAVVFPSPADHKSTWPVEDRQADGPIAVLIVDDQALVRAGFAAILEKQPDIEVVGEAADGRAAIRLAEQTRPDVVLMDVRMPELDGIEATRQLRGLARPSRVLMLTTFDLDEYVYAALRAGACGFLLKDVPREELVNGIRAVHRGDALLAPAITRRLIEDFVRRPIAGGERAQPLARLTERELDVLLRMAYGRSDAEIAGELFLSEATIKTHVTRILQKTGARDRVQATLHA
jgi:DNA-binding NarL/FixJ family response regulator